MAAQTKATKMWRRAFAAQYVVITVAVCALAGLILVILAVSMRSFAATATTRECGDVVNGVHNSIANNPDSGGGCGSLTPEELITDIQNGNPDDQAGIYAHFGLSSGDYTRFKNTAQTGVAKMNGDIVVDNQVVMKNAWSVGRVKFGYSSDYPITGVGTYYKSMHTDVLKSEIPVMVMFDGNGTAEAAVLTSCGNPVQGEKIKSSAVCKKLNKMPVSGKENTFTFNTEVGVTGLAKVTKLEYFANGELFDTTASPEEVTKQMTFTEDTTIVVKVTVSLPGSKTKVVTSELCKQFIEVKKKEVPPPPEKPKEQPKVQSVTVTKPTPKPPAPAQPMPVTGAEGVFQLFAGVAAAGALGHRLFAAYRSKR